eukprot:2379522-Rhodomonas_salina.1
MLRGWREGCRQVPLSLSLSLSLPPSAIYGIVRELFVERARQWCVRSFMERVQSFMERVRSFMERVQPFMERVQPFMEAALTCSGAAARDERGELRAALFVPVELLNNVPAVSFYGIGLRDQPTICSLRYQPLVSAYGISMRHQPMRAICNVRYGLSWSYLRTCYAKPGTDPAYGATGIFCTGLRAWYAMCGTDAAYGATRHRSFSFLGTPYSRRYERLSTYARATQCPVLAKRMLQPTLVLRDVQY